MNDGLKGWTAKMGTDDACADVDAAAGVVDDLEEGGSGTAAPGLEVGAGERVDELADATIALG